jgi:hypothetical protein
MDRYVPNRRFGHQLRLADLRALWFIPVAAVLLALWVFLITGDPLRMLLAVPLAGLLWLLLFVLGSLSYWVELSAKALRLNQMTGVTPGGPITGRTTVKYTDMRSLTVKPGLDKFGRVDLQLTYRNKKRATERTADFSIDELEVAEFIDLLQRRTADQGIELLILR